MIDYSFESATTRLVRLEPGEDLIGSLTRFASERDIRAASLTFLGAVRRASLRYYHQGVKEYRDFSIDAPLELISGVGNISVLEDGLFVHAHAVFADPDGRGYGGHVNEGTEAFMVEATVFELDGPAPVRRFDEETGLMVWGQPPPG